MAKRAEGAKNFKELTEQEKDMIIEKYFERNMSVEEIRKYFNLTKRTMPLIFKERGINSFRKNRYTLNEKYFSNVDTERKAYWLGYLYADGFVGDEYYNNIVFAQKESDGYIVKQFANDINFTGELRRTKSSGGFEGQHQLVINFSSKQMANDLKTLKMETCKSTTMKDLPPIKEDLVRHFVRGYLDGDGSISRSVRHVYANGKKNYAHRVSMIGTKPFLEKIAELLPCKTVFVDSHTEEMKYLYIWHNASMEPLAHYLYDNATFCSLRKYNKMLQILGDIGVKVPIENGINSQEGLLEKVS